MDESIRPFNESSGQSLQRHARMVKSSRTAQTFAILLPQTKAATDTILLRPNRPRREDFSAYNCLQHRDDPDLVARLDFAFLIGRSKLSFGTDRAADFRLLEEDNVSKVHFLIHFDMGSGNLQITDISLFGTWIKPKDSEVYTLVHGRTCTLHQRTTIMVGSSIVFQVVLPLVNTDEAFRMLFQQYKDSLDRRSRAVGGDGKEPPQSAKRRGSSVSGGSETQKRTRLNLAERKACGVSWASPLDGQSTRSER